MLRNWEDRFPDDIKLLNEIIEAYGSLNDNDITGAYQLQKDSLQAYMRFSELKYNIKRELLRGEETALKERLNEITTYLYSVHVACRKVYEKSSGDLKYYKEV